MAVESQQLGLFAVEIKAVLAEDGLTEADARFHAVDDSAAAHQFGDKRVEDGAFRVPQLYLRHFEHIRRPHGEFLPALPHILQKNALPHGVRVALHGDFAFQLSRKGRFGKDVGNVAPVANLQPHFAV